MADDDLVELEIAPSGRDGARSPAGRRGSRDARCERARSNGRLRRPTTVDEPTTTGETGLTPSAEPTEASQPLSRDDPGHRARARRDAAVGQRARSSASTCRAASRSCSSRSARTSRATSLDQAVDIIRNRVDSLGVAEPEISRQGDNIVVDLPGVKDRDKARRIVGRTAELRFRPVLAARPAGGEEADRPRRRPPRRVRARPRRPVDRHHDHDRARRPATAAAQAAIASCDVDQLAALPTIPTTQLADDQRDACVVLPFRSRPGQRPALPRPDHADRQRRRQRDAPASSQGRGLRSST